MPNTIGLAGRTHGLGRVAAFTKAFSNSDFTISGQNQDLLIQLFLNALNWCINPAQIDVHLHDTDNSLFNSKIASVVNSRGYNCIIKPAWYKSQTIQRSGARIIIPSYNANLGLKMPDTVQNSIMYEVARGEGLLLGEWFHLLQSMPTRRSFSLSTNINQGLYTISPILLDLTKNVVITSVDELLYIKTKEDDSMSYTLPPRFSVENISQDVNFSSHLSQLPDIYDDAVVFWSTDVEAISNTTTTTTTTTTEAPDSELIKMKLFNVDMIDYCGPQNWYLDGPDKDNFSFDGKHVYLTKYLDEEQTLEFYIVAEDYFDPERFNKKIQPVEVVLKECDSPITQPKNNSYKTTYSYRAWWSAEQHILKWGENAITGVINDFNEWEVIGKGDSNDPKIAYLGGMHSDMNILWLQLNNGGTVSGRMNTSLSAVSFQENNPYISDFANLYYISNTLTDDVPDIHPFQHTKDVFNDWDQAENVTRLSLSSQGLTGNQTQTFTFNVEDPNELDSSGNRVRGDAYLALYLRKTPLRSEYDDRVYLTAYYGSILTTPPPVFTYNVFIINNVDGTYLSTDSISFSSKAQNTPLPPKVFTIYSNNGLGINSLSATDNSDILTVEVGTITSPVSGRTIEVTLEKMPVNGGAATIILSGSTVSTTTTTPPPQYEVTINVLNNVQYTNTYLDVLSATSYGIAGQVKCVTVQYIYSISGYEWPATSDIPTLSLVSSSPNGMVNMNTSSVYRFWSYGLNALIATVCFTVPEGGGIANLRIDNNPPVPTTTTTTTTTSAPCSNLIQIICEQTLICNENNNGECQASLPISQIVKYSTCCNIADEDILSIIRSANGASSTATLQEIYSSSCPSSTNTALNPCQPKDQDGNCQETIHSVVIDEISCGSSDNPLP